MYALSQNYIKEDHVMVRTTIKAVVFDFEQTLGKFDYMKVCGRISSLTRLMSHTVYRKYLKMKLKEGVPEEI